MRNKEDILVSITNNTSKPYLIKKGIIGTMQIDYEPKNKISYKNYDLNSILNLSLSEIEPEYTEIDIVENDENINEIIQEREINNNFSLHGYDIEHQTILKHFDFIKSHLTSEEFQKLVRIILEFNDVYAQSKYDVG